MSTENTWSEQQSAIFNWFATSEANGRASRHLVVRARAGTGKTTTIVEATSRAPDGKILLAAFNKKIAVELQGRLANPNAEAATLHSIGFSFVKRFWERVGIDQDRAENLARAACGNDAPDAMVRLVAKLNSRAREIIPHAGEGGAAGPEAAKAIEEMIALADEHDCLPDEDWSEDGFTAEWIARSALRAMSIAAREKPARGIDFADMIFLPIRNRWLRPRYDLVVVDEAQDMTAAQLEIARGVSRDRVAVVGDDRQAIYGFRGADAGSLDRLKAELGAEELGLTTTYRCGRAIVARAAALVPDYTAAPSAPEGAVVTVGFEPMAERVAAGDFVLSRKNAPLVKTALKILRTGKRAKVEGRDIGAGLRALVKKLAGKSALGLGAFLEKLSKWEEREIARAEAMGPKGESKIEKVVDQAETLRVLADGLSGVRELEARIDDLFSDDPVRGTIVCSSIHRSKGLEADRVWILTDTLYPAIPCECGHRHSGACSRCSCAAHRANEKRRIEEQNLDYVATTRAKRELFLVFGTP